LRRCATDQEGIDQEGQMKRIRFATGATAAAIGGLALLPTGASADTVTIGSALQHPDTPAICTNCVGVQRSQAGGNTPLSLISRVNGVVTEWAVRTSDPGATQTFRILRPAGGTSYTGAGSSSPIAVPAGTTDSTLHNAVSLPIKQGDAIGVAVSGTASGLPQFTSNNGADVIGFAAPSFPDGSSSSFFEVPGHELLLQATIQFCNVPTLKKLKTKPAKQLLRTHDCLPKVKRSRVKKEKFSGRVLKQKIPPGTTAAPGTVVPIVIGTKK
jgi:hypothetical protein